MNFSQHEYGFWKFCIEKTNALPLKSTIDLEDSYIEVSATEIKRIDIDDSEFDIPNLTRVESPEK